ncbi:MAG: hypothetical protein ACJAW4_000133 [Paracoccaceae bacterium]|jgi:hypothetical protein
MAALLRALVSTRLFVAVVILGTLMPAHGADRAGVAKVLEDGGVRQMLGSLSGAADAVQANPPGGMPGRLPDMMRLRFDPHEMFDDMADSVARLVSDGDVAVFSAFLASPLGRRLTAAEIAHAEQTNPDQAANDLVRYYDEGRRRRGQIARMDRALHMTDIALSISRTVTRSMLAGILGAQGNFDMGPEDIDAIAGRLTAEQADKTREAVLASTAGAYAAISHEDMDAYVNFLETPEAGAFYGAMLGSLRGMLEIRARLLGEDIAAAARQREL